MTLSYDLYWSFRSPYSYFVTRRLLALERDYDVACNVRVVYPIAVRQPEFFDKNDPLWLSYFMRDIFRCAEFLGLPFGWPRPDPVVMDIATRTYPKEQPYIHRLTRLGQAASETGRGLAFLDEVSALIFGDAVRDWHRGDHLAAAAARAGVNLAALTMLVVIFRDVLFGTANHAALSGEDRRREAVAGDRRRAAGVAAGVAAVPVVGDPAQPTARAISQ